ncbi:hypothetical protein [Eubacterium sp. 1001713B170207_170306_E7]|uniref:hypothetical protein n=1 Tax=Eubacterium sp. 1001713B170207_170306_E7 TaxID=2787097 RepID=UPI00189B4B57|nr:hypothetical protein [Eubacterium sp. 1001713B170207_170306_E7]
MKKQVDYREDEYDERQEMLMGKVYKHSFAIALLCIYLDAAIVNQSFVFESRQLENGMVMILPVTWFVVELLARNLFSRSGRVPFWIIIAFALMFIVQLPFFLGNTKSLFSENNSCLTTKGEHCVILLCILVITAALIIRKCINWRARVAGENE